MAIVRTQKIGNTIIYTDDSAYRDLTLEQIEWRRKIIQDHVDMLAERIRERKIAELLAAEEEKEEEHE